MVLNKFDCMIGSVLSSVDGEPGDETMVFHGVDGSRFVFYHSPSCCESVCVDDIIGEITDLVGSPILEAEQISSDEHAPPENADSYTWTFYRFSTIKGTVTVKWLGESNGYYSEEVDFRHEKP